MTTQSFIDARREAAAEMAARMADVFNSLDRLRTLGERLGLDDPSDLAAAWEKAMRAVDGLEVAIAVAVKG